MIALFLAAALTSTDMARVIQQQVYVGALATSEQVYEDDWNHSSACATALEAENAAAGLDEILASGSVWDKETPKVVYTLTDENRKQLIDYKFELQSKVRKWQHRCHE
jgi:hypothetical protein